MRATLSRSAEAAGVAADEARSRLPTLPERPAILRDFRARLVLAFAAVVAIALALVLAALPRLLDGYFLAQERQSLETRTPVISVLVAQQLLQAQRGGQQPLMLPTDPPTVSSAVLEALGSPDDPQGRVAILSQLAQADLTIRIAADASEPDRAWALSVPVRESATPGGQQRDDISSDWSLTIRDTFWAQTGIAAPDRRVTVTLSRPFTFRAQTLETIVGVMTLAAGLAMLVAILASVLLAAYLTSPIRRLTQATRALEEGRLDERVGVPAGGSPEVGELSAAFNKMADRLQRSMEYIRSDRDRSREFLADVSHELRTPIAALRTFNELLQDGAAADPSTRGEFLEQSGRQIERLDWLATNLLELSKLDSGLVALDLRPEDLRAVVENAVQQASPGAQRKGVELVMEVPAEPVRQRHDPQRMGQVLGNLIGNALKFTPTGGRVDVRLEPTSEGAEISVRDSGVGIDPAELPRVFERFFRGSQAHEARAGGSGLGLAIVRSVVEMHGGHVTVESTPGKGTDVRVTLPRDVSVSSPADARP